MQTQKTIHTSKEPYNRPFFYGKDSRLNSSVGISIFSSLRCTLLLEAISVNSSIYYCGIDPLSHRSLGQKNNNSSFRATISISWEQRKNESWVLLCFVKSCQTPHSKITAYNGLLLEFDIPISFKEKFNDLERHSAYHKWQQKFSIKRHLIFLPRGRGTNHMVSVCSPQLVFQVQCNIDQVQHMSQTAHLGTTTRSALCCIERVTGHRLYCKLLSYNISFCTNALPETSKLLQAPSGLSIPSFMNCTDVLGFSKRLTPPTRAALHRPWQIAL